MKILLLAVLASTLAALGGSGAAGALGSGSPRAAATVRVTLVEFKLTPSTKRVAAGKVTFSVHNAGKLAHEFVLLRTKTPASRLPTRGMQARETGNIGEIPTFGPRSTKRLTRVLKPGHYALICNLPGHYEAGQFADFTVG